jgi:hypothetical protein
MTGDPNHETTATSTLGIAFAEAFAAKDYDRFRELASDEVRALEHVETDTIVDRERVGYRLSVANPDGRFVVEQQAYVAERDGRIGWMRVLCSGFRPAD